MKTTFCESRNFFWSTLQIYLAARYQRVGGEGHLQYPEIITVVYHNVERRADVHRPTASVAEAEPENLGLAVEADGEKLLQQGHVPLGLLHRGGAAAGRVVVVGVVAGPPLVV